jgi:hypothetical protein
LTLLTRQTIAVFASSVRPSNVAERSHASTWSPFQPSTARV